MAGNYQKGMYDQLMEVMARLDAVEKDLHTEKVEHKNDVDCLNAKIDSLTQENQLLKDDNARLKSIINNDSSNTSLPPSTDQKGTRPANTFNGRKKTERKAGGQKGHKGTTLTKSDMEDKIRSGKCRHEIMNTGDSSRKNYVTKYVMDLSVAPVITEVRIYPDENGHFSIPPEYRSDVTYGANIKSMAGSSSNLVGNRYSYHRFRGGIIVVKQRYVKGAVLHFVETLDIPLLHNYWVPKESMNRVVMPLS